MALARAAEQLEDLYPALMLFFATLERFGYSHRDLTAAMHRKLTAKGYTSARPPQFAVGAKEVA